MQKKLDLSLDDLVKGERKPKGDGPAAAGRKQKGRKESRSQGAAEGSVFARLGGGGGKAPPKREGWRKNLHSLVDGGEKVLRLYDTEVVRIGASDISAHPPTPSTCARAH